MAQNRAKINATPTPQLRASPLVLGITHRQLRNKPLAEQAASYRAAAQRLMDLADELDGVSP